MNIWVIFLIIAVIALIGVFAWATINLVKKALELFESIKGLIDKIKTSEIIDQLGLVLKQLAELEDLIKTKLGVDEKKKLDEMKETLENIRRKIG